MTSFTRGFRGRGGGRDKRLPPGQYDTGQSWPVLTAEVTPRIDSVQLDVHRRRVSSNVADDMDVGRDACPAAERVRRGHPLRDDVVEVRHALGGCVARRVVRDREPARACHTCRRVLLDRLHHEPSARRHHGRQGVGRVHVGRRAAVS